MARPVTTSRFDPRFALRTILIALGLGLVVFVTHSLQMKRHAADQLERATEVAESEDQQEFVAALNRYLSFDPRNKDVRIRYGLALAKKAITTHDRWRALQALRQVLAESPTQAEVRLKAIELALALEDPVQAAKHLEPLLLREPGRADLHVLAARCELARNKLPGAIASLSRALELAPDEVETAELLAGIYVDQLHQPRLAQAVFDRLVEANPTLATAHLARARHALRESKPDDAAKDLETAAGLAPRDIDIVQTQAEVETLRGNLDRASGLWKRSIELSPARIGLFIGLAKVEQGRGQPALAIDALREARKLDPKRPDLVFWLADLLIDGGKVAESRDLSRQFPESPSGQADFLRGRIAQGERRWLDAINAYIGSLKSSEMQGELAGRAYLEMSRCYEAMGGRVEEMQSLEAAVRLSPSATPRLILSERLIQARRFGDAIPLLKELTAMKPPLPQAWGLLARALVEQNRLLPTPKRRWNEVENAIDRAKGDPDLEVSLTLVKADMYGLRDQIDQAKKILRTACEVHPEQPALYLALAEISAREGDFRTAKAALARGDKALKNRLDWLWLRIDWQTRRRNEQSPSELNRLESRLGKVSSLDRAQLERHLVEVHKQMGNHSDVERLCARLLGQSGNDAQVRFWLVESQLARNHFREAKRQVAALRKLEGEAGLGWRCATAEMLIRQTGDGEPARLEEARILIDYARKARPNWSQPIFLGASLEDKKGKTEAALAEYRRVLDLGDYRPLALSRVLRILADEKRWAEAFAVCESALRKGALDPEMQRVAADLAVKADQKSRAHDIATMIVPESNANYRDHLWLGELLDAASRPSSAREAYERAVELAPDGVTPYLALISHLVRNRHRAEAAEVLERMKATLDEQRSAMAVARGYELLTQPDMAESTYREILKRRPEDPEALDRLAGLLVRYDKNVEAEPVLRRLLSLRGTVPDEDIPGLRRKLGLVLTAPEQGEERVGEALELLSLNEPREGDAAVEARTLALVRGRRADQRGASLRSVEALPPLGMNPQEKFRLAHLYDAHGNAAKARALLLDIIRRDPVNTAAISDLVEGLLRDQRRTECAEWIERLDKLEPGSDRVEEFRHRYFISTWTSTSRGSRNSFIDSMVLRRAWRTWKSR